MNDTTALIAGTGAHALVVHFAVLVDQAEHDLVRAPDHLRLFVVTLRAWRRSIESGPKKLEVNDFAERGIDVVRQFGGPLPSPSVAHLPADEIRRRLAGLVNHGWLRPIPGSGTGTNALYRAHTGDVFGATP